MPTYQIGNTLTPCLSPYFENRYPHPGERKNEWSFADEGDIKKWVLTADSDWGEGYR